MRKKQPTYFNIIIFSIFSIVSCQNRKDVAIDQGKVQEILTPYGKENPEKKVVIHVKNYGDIHIKLYDETPLHRANFIRMVKSNYYNQNSTFYRIISDFMIQGGDQTTKLQKFTLPSEFNDKFVHKKGALAMARWDENNPEKRSSPTEFFIIRGRDYTEESLQDALKESDRKHPYSKEQIEVYLKNGGDARMDGKYTVFGEVTQGFELIDKIADVQIYDGEKPVVKIPFTIEIE